MSTTIPRPVTDFSRMAQAETLRASGQQVSYTSDQEEQTTMNRYNFSTEEQYEEGEYAAVPYLDPKGEYVRFEDVQQIVKALQDIIADPDMSDGEEPRRLITQARAALAVQKD